MGAIEALLAEHCPDGVEYRALSAVCRIKNGRDYKHLGPGDVPVYGTGGIMGYVGTSAYQGPTVLIPRKGSLANLFYVEGPVWTVDTIFYTEIDDALIEPKFLFYCLSTLDLAGMNQAGGIPSQTQAALKPLPIPVPPLPVQRAVVEALSAMEALQKSLLDEEEARRQQHEHYRDRLILSITQEDSWSRLGDVTEVTRGRRFVKADYVSEEGGIPAIHYADIYTAYGTVVEESVHRVRADMAKSLRYADPGSVIVTGVGETVDDIAKPMAWMGSTPAAFHDDSFAVSSNMNPIYLAHWFQTSAALQQKRQHVSLGKMKRISSTGLAALRLPVPTRAEQDRIANMLTTLDALTEDPSCGLRAEREARREQFEHYRDRLLTFPERTSAA